MRRVLPHTADLRAEITASDLAGLFREAAELVRELVVGDGEVEPRERRRIEVAGESDRERLFRFVRELLYLVDSEGFLPAAAELAGDSVQVTGEQLDPSRHQVERQLKAVTRHRFELEREGAGWRCAMVFDL